MKTWQECCDTVGYNPKDYNPPEQTYKYFAYKSGEAKEFENEKDAKVFSKNYERVRVADPQVKLNIEAYWNGRRSIEQAAAEVWQTAFNKEFEYLPCKVFSLCYSKAYDGHSSGYDEVFNQMEEIVAFAEEIMEAVKYDEIW